MVIQFDRLVFGNKKKDFVISRRRLHQSAHAGQVAAPYLAIFEQGTVLIYFLLLLGGGGGGGRDDTFKIVIVTLSNLWGGQLPPCPPARHGPGLSCTLFALELFNIFLKTAKARY